MRRTELKLAQLLLAGLLAVAVCACGRVGQFEEAPGSSDPVAHVPGDDPFASGGSSTVSQPVPQIAHYNYQGSGN